MLEEDDNQPLPEDDAEDEDNNNNNEEDDKEDDNEDDGINELEELSEEEWTQVLKNTAEVRETVTKVSNHETENVHTY